MPQNDQDAMSQLLSNSESVSRLFELASALSAQKGAASAPEPVPAAVQEDAQASDMSQVLAALLAQGRPEAEAQSDPPPRQNEDTGGATGGSSFAAVMEMLPQLLQALNGDGSTLPSERVNLVQAIKPYAGERGDSIDRAVRMAGVAKAAKSALNLLGKRSE